MSSVTFVMDYLQVAFDGKRFTAYSWPAVIEPGKRTVWGDRGYRDALCSLIAKVVAIVSRNRDALTVSFSEGIALEFDVRDEDGQEKLVYEEPGAKYTWAYW